MNIFADHCLELFRELGFDGTFCKVEPERERRFLAIHKIAHDDIDVADVFGGVQSIHKSVHFIDQSALAVSRPENQRGVRELSLQDKESLFRRLEALDIKRYDVFDKIGRRAAMYFFS